MNENRYLKLGTVNNRVDDVLRPCLLYSVISGQWLRKACVLFAQRQRT